MSQQEPDQPEASPTSSSGDAGAVGGNGSVDPVAGGGRAGAVVPDEQEQARNTTTASIAALGAGYLALTTDWTWALVGVGVLVMLLLPQLGNIRMGIMVGLLAFIGVVHGWVWVIMVVALLVMIFLHELGHFLTARWSGMKATEFFLGFGPKLWSFTRGETEYGVKAIPAGAYVRIIGMTTAEEVPPEDETRTYRHQSFPKRLLVVSAGSLMHLGQAVVVALVLLVALGVPGGKLINEDPAAAARTDEDWVVEDVVEGSAADAAGLQPGDRVVAWDGARVDTFEEVVAEVDASEVGEDVTLTVLRDGETFESSTEVVDRCAVTDNGFEGPFLGIGPRVEDDDREIERRDPVGGTVQAGQDTGEVLWLTMQGVGNFATNLPDFLAQPFDRDGEVGEPCTEHRDDDVAAASGGDGSNDREMMSILGAIRIGSGLDARGLLTMFFLINLTIGLINMLPMLPLDGGHAVVAIYERVRSRAGARYYADATKLIPFAYAGFMLLMVIGTTALFLDITDPVRL